MFAQSAIVTGEASVIIDENMSKRDAMALAEQNAKIKALESLGTEVSRRSQRTVLNSSEITETEYSSVSTVRLMADWMRTNEGYPKFDIREKMVICEIKGVARKHSSSSYGCTLSFGSDKNSHVFKEGEIQINIESDNRGYAYLLGQKVGSDQVSLLLKPLNSADKDVDNHEITGILDDKRNSSEGYRIYLIHSKNEINVDLKRFEDRYNSSVPEGWESPKYISEKGKNNFISRLIRDKDFKGCIVEESFSIIQ